MSDAPLSVNPPASAAGAAPLVLTAPEPVAAVAPAQAPGAVPIDAAALPGLDAKVAEYVGQLTSLDVKSPAFSAKAADVRAMGDADVRRAAETSNRLLDKPMKALRSGQMTEGAKVAGTLLDLRRTIEDLDPSEATGTKKLLGLIPFGDKLVDYFRRYESAQGHLDAIIKALYDGQDELRKDNAALEQEKVHLWEAMQRLAQYIYIADKLDKELEAQIATIALTDPDKAKALRDDVLFYVRQKHQDLLTQQAVAIQGYLAMDLLRRNNLELIKGVDRATTTTVAALRTAVIVAQALADQRLVLDQITALNTTTSELIRSTSELLASQSVEIHGQAAAATLSIEHLQAAFANVYQTMDAIDTFKAEALESMAVTVSTLETEVGKAQSYLSRARAAEQRDTEVGGLDLGGR